MPTPAANQLAQLRNQIIQNGQAPTELEKAQIEALSSQVVDETTAYNLDIQKFEAQKKAAETKTDQQDQNDNQARQQALQKAPGSIFVAFAVVAHAIASKGDIALRKLWNYAKFGGKNDDTFMNRMRRVIAHHPRIRDRKTIPYAAPLQLAAG